RIVGITSPAPERVWKTLIDVDPDAMPYQSPEWAAVACATGKFVDASRLYEMDGGHRYVGPLLGRAGLPDWLNIASSMPSSWGIGGIVGSAPLTPQVLDAIIHDLRGTGFLGVHIRPNPLHAE